MSLGIKKLVKDSYARGWLESEPLGNYSSLHELSVGELLGLSWPLLQKHFFIQLSSGLHTPLHLRPDVYLTFHTRDSDKPAAGKYCYTIANCLRWRVDVSAYKTMEEFISSRKRWNRCTYAKSKKVFQEYGCTISLIEGDWTEHVETCYKLYENVAKRHGDKLYDMHFFRKAAKRPDYPILCAWLNGQMIGFFLLQSEPPTLHSIFCGLDYENTTKCYAYSWLHFELIRIAIEKRTYQIVDVGITADECKKSIGFEPVAASMDIYSNGFFTRNALRLASLVTHATIDSRSQLKFGIGPSKAT